MIPARPVGAVDDEWVAVDARGVLRQQEAGGRGDLLGLAEPAQLVSLMISWRGVSLPIEKKMSRGYPINRAGYSKQESKMSGSERCAWGCPTRLRSLGNTRPRVSAGQLP